MESDTNARRRQALGRGLGALIPGAESTRTLFFCPIDQIVPSADQPRSAINPTTLRDLADSIRESGVLQPVLLKREGLRYRLVAGERRWRAAKMAGLDKIPAMVKEVNDGEAYALALIENIQREDLTPLEEAMAYRRLIDEYGYTQKNLADKIGKGRSTVANTLRLLDLPDTIKRHVNAGSLSAGHARAVLSVPPDEQLEFAQQIIDNGASVREAEAEARPVRRAAKESPKLRAVDPQSVGRNAERRANLARLEGLIRDSLQTRVRINDRDGRGRIELFYDDDASLQEIADRLLENKH